MKLFKPVFAFLTCQALAFNTLAAGNITYLNVIDDVVYFTTDDTQVTPPECAVAETATQWTIPLTNKTGRALYSMLVTAMAAKQPVTIASADDCAVIDGFKRAKGINLVPVIEDNSAKTSVANSNILSHAAEVGSGSTMLYSPSGHSQQTDAFFKEVFPNRDGAVRNSIVFNRKLIKRVEGSGWLTAILTSYTADTGTGKEDITTVEVVIDGESQVFELTGKKINGRFFFGLTSQSEHDTYASQIVAPLEVVTQGKGVPFKSSLEVWVKETNSQTHCSTCMLVGVQYYMGHDFTK